MAQQSMWLLPHVRTAYTGVCTLGLGSLQGLHVLKHKSPNADAGVQGSRDESAQRTMSAPGNSSSLLPSLLSPSLLPITAFMEPCAAEADDRSTEGSSRCVLTEQRGCTNLQGTCGGWMWLVAVYMGSWCKQWKQVTALQVPRQPITRVHGRAHKG